jgi:hypothetical protein
MVNKMKVEGYLTTNKRGSARFTKTKTTLNWDEISIKISFVIPDELFQRPTIEAKLEVSSDVIPKPQPVEAIINTKELIEQSTGAKINFSVVPYDEDEQ